MIYFFYLISDLLVLSFELNEYKPLEKKHFLDELQHFHEFQIEQFRQYETYIKKYIYEHFLNEYRNIFKNKEIKFYSVPSFYRFDYSSTLKKNTKIWLEKYTKDEKVCNKIAIDIVNEFEIMFNIVLGMTCKMLLNEEIKTFEDFKKIKEIKITRKKYFTGLYHLEVHCLNKYLLIDDYRKINPFSELIDITRYAAVGTNIILYSADKFEDFILPTKLSVVIDNIKLYGQKIFEFEKNFNLYQSGDLYFLDMLQNVLDTTLDNQRKSYIKNYCEYVQAKFLILDPFFDLNDLLQEINDKQIKMLIEEIHIYIVNIYNQIISINKRFEYIFKKHIDYLLEIKHKDSIKIAELLKNFQDVYFFTLELYGLEVQQLTCEFSYDIKKTLSNLYNLIEKLCNDKKEITKFSKQANIIKQKEQKNIEKIKYWLLKIFFNYDHSHIFKKLDEFIFDSNTSKNYADEFSRLINIERKKFVYNDVSEVLMTLNKKYPQHKYILTSIYKYFLHYNILVKEKIEEKEKNIYERLDEKKKLEVEIN